MPDVANCRGCGARIGWLTLDSGKRMPVDLKPLQSVVVEDLEGCRVIQGYRPHWASCPAADQFKKERK